MQPKGMRIPEARYHNTIPTSRIPQQPIAILGNRVYEGAYQYEVQWEGQDYTSWHDADSLDCIEMMEEYELQKE